jgi:TldD protein
MEYRLPQTILEKLLGIALSRGGNFAEIYIEHTVLNTIALEEDKIKEDSSGVIQGVGIRVISGEKTGYAYSDDFSYENLEKAAKTAALIADSPKRDIGPVSVSKIEHEGPSYYLVKIPPDAVEVKKKSDLLWRANTAAKAYDPRIIQVMASFVDMTKDLIIVNSDGLWAEDKQTICRLNVTALAEDKGIRQRGYYGGGGLVGFDFYTTFTPEIIAQEAARQAIVQLTAAEAPAGIQTVVLNHGWSGVLLHEAVGHGLEGDFIRKKTSFYTGKIGQKVASELCTVVDDATLAGKRGSIHIDDEGTPGQRKVLIEKGILKDYMYDRLNAGLMKHPSTGNGRRESFRHIPMPRMTNTFMLAGEDDPEDIIRSVQKGFYAKTLGGGQVDITSGNFVFQVSEGYLIEGGRITRPVRGATLIGNGPDILTRVTMVGNDLEFDTGIGTCGKNGQSKPVGVGLPTVKISEMTVGGTAM